MTMSPQLRESPETANFQVPESVWARAETAHKAQATVTTLQEAIVIPFYHGGLLD
jgi:hypothetical protein